MLLSKNLFDADVFLHDARLQVALGAQIRSRSQGLDGLVLTDPPPC